jgi:hypothetical protein
MINNKYNKRRIEYEANLMVQEIPPPVVKSKNEKRQRSLEEEDLFPNANNLMAENKLSIYLRGTYKLATTQADEALHWCMVHYPFNTLLSTQLAA